MISSKGSHSFMGGLRRELGFGEVGVEASGKRRREDEGEDWLPAFRRTAGSGNVPKVALLASPFMHTCSGDPGGEVDSHIGSVHIHTPQAPSQATGVGGAHDTLSVLILPRAAAIFFFCA